jgi:hypothetical protein
MNKNLCNLIGSEVKKRKNSEAQYMYGINMTKGNNNKVLCSAFG